MTLYAVRKRSGQWAVCSDDNVVLHFETYDEAIEIARSAAGVLTRNRTKEAAAPAATLRQPREPCLKRGYRPAPRIG